ncbi:hypothetical protein BaRGS_00024406 [Batillaria attramentaria]|uniref:Uncharacterized protein n=1 Tax=Batillaria attramentaria TaxID=370345 RepID=A0ABD0KBR7_9CAEN
MNDAYRRNTMPTSQSSPLRMHAKQIISDLMKSNPASWPRYVRGGDEEGDAERSSGYASGYYPTSNGRDRAEQGNTSEAAPQEGADILRQMTLKFGASASASQPPLPMPPTSMDTLKRKTSGDVHCPSSEENSCHDDVPVANPRKRSRKGKAYKLDALCLKLQEKQAVSPYGSDSEELPQSSEMARMRGGEEDLDEENHYQMSDSFSDRRVERAVGTEHPDRSSEMDRSQNENAESEAAERGENPPVMDMEFEQLQKNIQILNSDVQSAEECSKNMNEDASLRQQDRRDETPSGELERHMSESSPPPQGMGEAEVDPVKERVSLISAIYQSQHDAVPPAVRRGTELALKIFNETAGGICPPNGKTGQAELPPLPVLPPSNTGSSPKNGMSHGLHKIALFQTAITDHQWLTLPAGHLGTQLPARIPRMLRPSPLRLPRSWSIWHGVKPDAAVPKKRCLLVPVLRDIFPKMG